jgi:hypothetical protein
MVAGDRVCDVSSFPTGEAFTADTFQNSPSLTPRCGRHGCFSHHDDWAEIRGGPATTAQPCRTWARDRTQTFIGYPGQQLIGPSSLAAVYPPNTSPRLLLTGLLLAGLGSLVALSPLGRAGAPTSTLLSPWRSSPNKLHPHDFAGYIVAQLLGVLTAAEGGGARLSLQDEQTAAATRTPGTGRDQQRGVELGRSAGTGPPGREMRDNLTPRLNLDPPTWVRSGVGRDSESALGAGRMGFL